jgi:hypothetical protein
MWSKRHGVHKSETTQVQLDTGMMYIDKPSILDLETTPQLLRAGRHATPAAQCSQ